MRTETIDTDVITGLQLIRDENDPPRYYVQERHKPRRELIAIGDEVCARSRFAMWRNRFLERAMRGDGRQRPVHAKIGRGAARHGQVALSRAGS